MPDVILDPTDEAATPIYALTEAETPAWLDAAAPFVKPFAAISEFGGKAGQLLLVPGEDGTLNTVLLGLGGRPKPMAFRGLAARLPAGTYRLAQAPEGFDAELAAVAFGLGAYRFDRYKTAAGARARLVAPPGVDADEVRHIVHASTLARDMVNTPANDLGPLQIETIAREIAGQYGAQITVVTGEGLLEANYPAIHAVGRAAAPHRQPRMIEISWGDSGPLIAIVGKGVVFDTGGLDIKPSSGMRLMKKDMGGAAHALALGRMVMAAGLPVRLAILVPVAENAISGDAMRPSDIIASRLGLSIEVGNTDAEGRLILADALTRASELKPDLTLDLATLTGAARAALGPQLPPYYTDDDELAAGIDRAALAVADPVWRMPLWSPYAAALESDIADIKNDPDAWAQAGSITAALFLKRFAPDGPWAHFDIYAWNPRGQPGAPVGAEAQAIRGLYRMLKDRFA